MNPKEVFDKILGPVKPQVDKLKEQFTKLSSMQKLVIGAGGAVLVVALIVFTLYSGGSKAATGGADMVKLFYSAREEPELSKLTEILDSAGKKYEVNNGFIYVGRNKRADLIMFLQNKGYGVKGLKGYDIFKLPQWSADQFVNDIKAKQALTQELRKHLRSLSFLSDAEVMITQPKDSVYRKSQKPWKVSIVLKPKAYEKLSQDRVKAVQSIAEAACNIGDAVKMNITITNGLTGLKINDFDADIEKIQDRLKYAQAVLKIRDREIQKLSRRVTDYLSSGILAPERVSLIVNMKINWDEVKRKHNEIVPIVLREDDPSTPYDETQIKEYLTVSEKNTEEKYKGRLLHPGGPPGSKAQVPPGYKDMLRTNGQYEKVEKMRNNVFSRVEKEVTRQPFKFMRVDISVTVDGIHKWWVEGDELKEKYTPVSEEDLAKLKKGVQGAIGYDANRGDLVQVANIKFDHEKEKAALLAKIQRKKKVTTTLLIALGTLFSLFIGVLVFRTISKEMARRKRLREEQLAQEQELMRQSALKAAEEEGIEAEISLEEKQKNEVLEQIRKVAKERPADVASLLRTWILDES